MTGELIQSLRAALNQSVDAAKRRLRREAEAQVLAGALCMELNRYRPRKRLVRWLCERIAEGPL